MIYKVLEISTAHVTEETINALEREPDTNELGLCVHDKSGYGCYILIPQDYKELNLPKDLIDCFEHAKFYDCAWLCLDCDGEIIDALPQYEWG